LTLKVRTLTEQLAKSAEESKLKLHHFHTVVLVSKRQRQRLCKGRGGSSSDIVCLKNSASNMVYCRMEEFEDENDDDGVRSEECVYITKMMQFNLSTKEGDSVQLVINRNCKRLKEASRLFVTPILMPDDRDSNDDYNEEAVQREQYLKPYLCGRIMGENMIFETVSSVDKSKTMRFLVLEVEVMDDEDATECVVSSKTMIEVDTDGVEWTAMKMQNRQNKPVDFDQDVGSLNEEWNSLRQIVEETCIDSSALYQVGREPLCGVLLHGPPGTGKKLIVKALSHRFGDMVTVAIIHGPTDILSAEIGESERRLKRAFKYIANNAPGILFIDDLDAVIKYDNIRAALIGLMNSKYVRNRGVLVLASTNRIDKVGNALRRGGLFGEEIVFHVPDQRGRRQILQKMTHKMKMNEDVDLEEIAKRTNGFVGADLQQLVQGACRRALDDKGKIEKVGDRQDVVLKMAHFETTLKYVAPSRIKDIAVESPDVKWDDIGGLGAQKKTMQRMIQNPLLHPEEFEKFGSSGSRGCILWGPPGTGKTMMGKAIAKECNANFLYIKGPELLSPFYGGSEQRVREYFEKARAVAPTIMFFDELDALAPKRGASGNTTSDRVVNQLLSEMDGIQRTEEDAKKQLFFLGATNRPDIIDDALRRPGRMEQMVMVDLPDEEGRKDIFIKILSKIPSEHRSADVKDPGNSDLSVLVKDTEGYSGADIHGVIKNAINEVVNDKIDQSAVDGKQITMKLLHEMCRRGTASVSAAEREKYSRWKQSFGSFDQRNESKEEDQDGHQDIRDFVHKALGETNKIAGDVFAFLVDPERGAFDNLEDLMDVGANDMDELCEEAGIKHGNKVKFIRAVSGKKSVNQICQNE